MVEGNNKKIEERNTKQDKKSKSQTNESSQNSDNLDINKKKQGVMETKKSGDKKKDKKKEPKPLGIKKTEAVVNGRDLRISTKQAVAICRFIRGKNVDRAIADLEQVVKMKKAVPMKGEIPHRRGKGMMSGRYPVKAAKDFIRLLKSLKANAIYHEIELEKVRITAMANVASKPYKRFGQGRMKRSHVVIKLVPFEKFDIRKLKKDKMKGQKTKQMNEEQIPKSQRADNNNKNIVSAKQDKKSQAGERGQDSQKAVDLSVDKNEDEEDE